MAILRVVWATHYLRWVAILGTTAGAHAVAFFVTVSGGGAGNGPTVPEGHVTLYVAQAEPPSEVLPTPVRVTEQPADIRPSPVELSQPNTPPDRILPAPPAGNPSTQPPSPAACTLPQAHRVEARALTASTETLRRTLGAESREVDQPISLGDSNMPPRIVPCPAGMGSGNRTSSSVAASGMVAAGPGPGSSKGLSSSASMGGEGVDPDFALNGKPVYPVECRRGDCTGRAPCEGISRWRVTVLTPNARPSRIERVQSAGCEHLDASTESFLREAHIPRAGVFLLRFRFKLDGSR